MIYIAYEKKAHRELSLLSREAFFRPSFYLLFLASIAAASEVWPIAMSFAAPSTPQAVYDDTPAAAAMDRQDYAEAVLQWTKLLEIVGLTPEQRAHALWARSTAEDSLGRPDAALADINAALAIKNDQADFFIARGQYRMDAHDYEAAEQDFDAAVRLSGGPEAYGQRAYLRRARGKHAEAIADLDMVIKAVPKLDMTYTMRGEELVSLGKIEQGLKDFETAISLQPNSAETYAARGMAEALSGNRDRAVADLDHAVSLEPKTSEYYVRAGVFMNFGDYQRAIDDLNRIERADPDSLNTYFVRGIAFYQLGQFQQAIGDLRHVVDGKLSRKFYESQNLSSYAMVWLHLARLRAGAPDPGELAADAARLKPSEWPAPVLAYFQGKLSGDQVTAAAGIGDADDVANQQCDAAFFQAQLLIAAGKPEGAKPLLQTSADRCPIAAPERAFAATQLKGM